MNQPRLVGGRYQLLAPIGRGGMGVVWRALDTGIGREVAIKQVHLPPNLSPDDQARLRMRTLHEARTAAEVRHPAVVAIHDVVEDGGEPWIVMELVDGRSLDQVVKSGGPMSPEWAASIGLFVLSALAAAHARGLLHRDVKPGNVLLADDGRILLSDFGIATRTGGGPQGGAPMGTPGFTAPETLTEEPGRAAGPASDLWSLGATLYTAVEGVPPFARPTAMATHGAVMTEPPRPPQRAGALTPVLMRLLEKNPMQRPDTVALRESLQHLTGRTAATVPSALPASWTLPRIPVYGSAAAVTVAFVAALAIILATSSGPAAPATTPVAAPTVTAKTERPTPAATPTGTSAPSATPAPTGSPVARTPGKFTAVPRPCQLLTRQQATELVGRYVTSSTEPSVRCGWGALRDSGDLAIYATFYLYAQQGDGYETKLAEEHVQGAKAKAESEAGRGGSGAKHGEVFEIPDAGDQAVAWEVQETTFSSKRVTVYSVFSTGNIVGEVRYTRDVKEDPTLRQKIPKAIKYLAENLDAKG
ncbi:serine/threonine protein kinase [Nonomuraea fuscirosea]|uniref:non-specific serine/threonine protein kinase n=1 Tax=Nonomuraea fuscirosea TaxID=1291556 RepID=A0A2T0N3K5_9ACTN|nr:serine/threonine-protein kinase [Nonomuraea fuscirosea]PRX66764.1 serine/threonine protein kinase [Nonomuraea fuscirosea]